MEKTSGRKVDFLRQIVNRVLAESQLPRQVVEDVRRMVGRAEDKYKFSAFGGDIRRLADYISSREFDDLVNLLKGADALNVLIEILERAKEAYRDYPEVVKAIEERLEEIKGKAEKTEEKIDAAYKALKDLEEKGLQVKKTNSEILISYPPLLDAKVTYDKSKKVFIVEYKIEGRVQAESATGLYDAVKRLVNLVKELA
ncbi:MAG: hypothetical protein GXO09_01780 [Crenarchaeota archaeon]|nr:hypothetical protein [Thermoproteota archaeon]